MIFSAKNKHDDVCMYLSLRTTNINEEGEDGLNALFIMLQRNEISRCKQLLRRGADINYENRNGITALHFAIEERLPENTIRFLIDFGAKIHFEDKTGMDACDKVKKYNLYPRIKRFYDGSCVTDPSVRTKRNENKLITIIEDNLMERFKIELSSNVIGALQEKEDIEASKIIEDIFQRNFS